MSGTDGDARQGNTSATGPVRTWLRNKDWDDWIETVAVVLLATASLAAAWSGYQAALWGGGLNPAARKVLTRVCAALDVSAYELVQMEALLRMQQSARQSQDARQKVDRVAQAYEVLGVPTSATDGEVTKAYRRLMNQNHPDKLHAKGLPESMMKVAEEKTRQIRAAYEVLRDARGMK